MTKLLLALAAAMCACGQTGKLTRKADVRTQVLERIRALPKEGKCDLTIPPSSLYGWNLTTTCQGDFYIEDTLHMEALRSKSGSPALPEEYYVEALRILKDPEGERQRIAKAREEAQKCSEPDGTLVRTWASNDRSVVEICKGGKVVEDLEAEKRLAEESRKYQQERYDLWVALNTRALTPEELAKVDSSINIMGGTVYHADSQHRELVEALLKQMIFQGMKRQRSLDPEALIEKLQEGRQ